MDMEIDLREFRSLDWRVEMYLTTGVAISLQPDKESGRSV